uniref:Uncharacterized protein n=1 Tax=Arundo donax TaxID=35708 RepID=A0A0A9ADL2_ARUDO
MGKEPHMPRHGSIVPCQAPMHHMVPCFPALTPP